MLDRELIESFRDVVNENGWVYSKYRNNNNRNQWNCICSAMDWITVSVDYINSHPLGKLTQFQSIELYAYLSSVDILIEAIEQLHRVIFSTNNRVFEHDSDCFCENKFKQNDRDFFKSLRSCFGAHPVNLEDPDFPGDKTSKRFASWSGRFCGEGDFSVWLYSNKKDGQTIQLGINFKQVNAFVKKYYNHLSTLSDKLSEQYSNFCRSLSSEKIPKDNNIISQLQILKSANCERFSGNDYYEYALNKLLIIFGTPITCSDNLHMVETYRSSLTVLVTEIYNNLQSMNLDDLEHHYLLETDITALPANSDYYISQLVSAAHGVGGYDFLWLKVVDDLFSSKFSLSYKTIKELYVLVLAFSHKQSPFLT